MESLLGNRESALRARYVHLTRPALRDAGVGGGGGWGGAGAPP